MYTHISTYTFSSSGFGPDLDLLIVLTFSLQFPPSKIYLDARMHSYVSVIKHRFPLRVIPVNKLPMPLVLSQNNTKSQAGFRREIWLLSTRGHCHTTNTWALKAQHMFVFLFLSSKTGKITLTKLTNTNCDLTNIRGHTVQCEPFIYGCIFITACISHRLYVFPHGGGDLKGAGLLVLRLRKLLNIGKFTHCTKPNREQNV